MLTEKREWDKEAFFQTGVDEIRQVMKHVEKLTLKASRGKALDFGCGPGRLTQALATYFDHVYGVDIAPSLLELARVYNQFGERCTYCLNEVGDLGVFGDQTFDFVYSARVLMHMDPRIAKNYTREFLRLLKPEGMLVFQVPSRYLYGIKRAKTRGPWLSFYVPEFLSEALSQLSLLTIRRGLQTVHRMEVHGIRKNSVVSLIEQNRGRVLEIVKDNKVPGWESFSYYCMSAREG